MKHVVVTGASTGIGRSCVEYLAARDFLVWGSVRKQADAGDLIQQFGDRFRPLIFDVTDENAIASSAARVREEIGNQCLAGLINNAGVAESGPLKDIPPDNVRTQLEVNVIGPLLVTQAFLPLLGAAKNAEGTPGRIVNMSSVSGKRAMPFLGPYAMSKFALEAQSDALRRELMLYGIDVVVIEPGPIVTPIWDKAAEIDVSAYAQSDYFPILQAFQSTTVEMGKQGLPPEEVAKTVYQALTLPRPRTRYVVMKNKWISSTLIALLPDRWLDGLIARRVGLKPKRTPD